MSSIEMWKLPVHPECIFFDVDSAKRAVNLFARQHGYAVVVKTVCKDARGQRRRVVLGCDRHSYPRKYKSTSLKRRVNTTSRRCGCPMELNLVRIAGTAEGREGWKVEHREKALSHNHAPSSHPSAHPVHRRAVRSEEIRAQIIADAQAGVTAAQTLARIGTSEEGRLVVARDIYNERQRGGRTQT